jgi:signal transduction histidine kinase
MGLADAGTDAVIAVPPWRLAVTAAAAGAVTIAIATLGLRALNGGPEPEGRNWWIAVGLVIGVAYLPIGVLVLVRSRRRLLGLLLAITGGGAALGALTAGAAAATAHDPSFPAGALGGALAGPLWLIAVAALAVGIPVGLAPVGPAGAARRVLTALGCAGVAAALPHELRPAAPWAEPSPANPFGASGDAAGLEALAQAGRWLLVAVATLALTAVVVDWWRRRRAGPELSLRAWVVLGCVVAWLGVVPVLATPIGEPVPGEAVALPLLLLATIPLLGVGLLALASRDWTWTSDAAAPRVLEWVLLTSAIAVLYTVVVAGLGVLVGGSGPTWLLVAATGVVAMAAEPLRSWSRSLVDHLLYGARRDPLAVVHAVMEHVTSVADVDALLPVLAQTVATALRVEHVRIDMAGPEGREVGGTSGAPAAHQEEMELRHAGEVVGWLVVGWRSGSSLRRGDRVALEDAAVQLAHAVRWVRLTQDLRRAVVGIASAREEERRRLRRDLHDGLGPALTGISLGVRSSIKELRRLPDASSPTSLLAVLADEIDASVADVKRITRDLQPTALDERDLVTAIGVFARRLDPVVRVHLDLPASCPKLPAAVEVATYRITSEALTNVVRHAHAENCWVRLGVDSSVEIDVRDDGIGLPDAVPHGVGLQAMRERVVELGGTLAIVKNGGAGTHLHVSLPARTA